MDRRARLRALLKSPTAGRLATLSVATCPKCNGYCVNTLQCFCLRTERDLFASHPNLVLVGGPLGIHARTLEAATVLVKIPVAVRERPISYGLYTPVEYAWIIHRLSFMTATTEARLRILKGLRRLRDASTKEKNSQIDQQLVKAHWMQARVTQHRNAPSKIYLLHDQRLMIKPQSHHETVRQLSLLDVHLHERFGSEGDTYVRLYQR